MAAAREILVYFVALLLSPHLLDAPYKALCSSSQQALLPERKTLDVSVGVGVGVGVGIGVSQGNPKQSSAPAPAPGPPEEKAPTPTAPPVSGPKPSDFLNPRQYAAYFVIQRFKRTITCDPNEVTRTWVGYRPCNYTGFYCASPPDAPDTPTIAAIDFNGFRLCAPTIKGFVDQLPDLALFHANSNNLSDTIPDFTGLKYFYELDVSNNNHSGPFPSNVLPLFNLLFLDLRFNFFVGPVAPAVFNIGVEVLFLNNNFFNESIPTSLGNTTANYLTLANNQFTGPIPSTISNLSSTLIEVLFLNNKLSGCLPYEIGFLRNATVFDAGFNMITGPIPWSFGCLQKVEQLNLAGNLLYGEVPDVVCQLAKNGGNLVNLSLSGNYFTSLGYSCWDLVKSKVLDVRENCIPHLPEQRSAAACGTFLCNKQNCPLRHDAPCNLPKCASSPPPVITDRLGWSKAPSRYKAYQALRKPQRNRQ